MPEHVTKSNSTTRSATAGGGLNTTSHHQRQYNTIIVLLLLSSFQGHWAYDSSSHRHRTYQHVRAGHPSWMSDEAADPEGVDHPGAAASSTCRTVLLA